MELSYGLLFVLISLYSLVSLIGSRIIAHFFVIKPPSLADILFYFLRLHLLYAVNEVQLNFTSHSFTIVLIAIKFEKVDGRNPLVGLRS